MEEHLAEVSSASS